MNNNWNQNEFLAFTLIYAAHADYEFANEEKDKIKEIVSEDIFNNLYENFIAMSDYSALETILSYKNLYYPTDDKKEKLLSKMQSLFQSDGDFSSIEKGLYNFLEKLM